MRIVTDVILECRKCNNVLTGRLVHGEHGETPTVLVTICKKCYDRAWHRGDNKGKKKANGNNE